MQFSLAMTGNLRNQCLIKSGAANPAVAKAMADTVVAQFNFVVIPTAGEKNLFTFGSSPAYVFYFEV